MYTSFEIVIFNEILQIGRHDEKIMACERQSFVTKVELPLVYFVLWTNILCDRVL